MIEAFSKRTMWLIFPALAVMMTTRAIHPPPTFDLADHWPRPHHGRNRALSASAPGAPARSFSSVERGHDGRNGPTFLRVPPLDEGQIGTRNLQCTVGRTGADRHGRCGSDRPARKFGQTSIPNVGAAEKRYAKHSTLRSWISKIGLWESDLD